MKSLATLLARIGTDPDPSSGAIAPPIHMASTYARDDSGQAVGGFVYSRLGNPTRQKLEEALAEIEGGHSCVALSSGMTCAMTLLQALNPGDHVLMPEDIYFGVRHLASTTFGRWGLDISTVDMSNLDAVSSAVRENTKIVWLETPSNPQLNVSDIEAISKIARENGAQTVVDSTWSTPCLTKPIDFGANVVLHSVTKYLGGHSDVLGGALVFKETTELSSRVHELQREAGAVLDPFSCWLTMRGMRSLIPRIARHCSSAMEIATHLEHHEHVDMVNYPGLPSHPGHEIASRQMKEFGGMLSFLVRGSEENAIQLARATELFTDATSLGGTESLIEHRASMEGEGSPTPRTLLRVSVGLEDARDLISDLDRALGLIFD